MRKWHRSPVISVMFALALGAMAGCSNQEPQLIAPTTPAVNWSEAAAPYQISFFGRSYDSEADQTTFTYSLNNVDLTTGEVAEAPVIHVFLDFLVELPACAPAPDSYSHEDAATIYTNPNGIYGIQWSAGYSVDTSGFYTITFPGEIALGTVRAMITTGGQSYVQNVPGPCESNHQIAGTVFIDGDGDGAQGLNELGISDVTVKLSGTEGDQTFKTDADGNYLFVAATGTYTVSIDETTADNSDYNESLYLTWDPTSPTSLEVTVGPDAADKDFGWEPDVPGIIAGIDSGDYPTDGKSYKWWRKEFLRVLNGQHNTLYTEEELLAFVHEIEALALVYEYDFTAGQELQQVYDILNNHAFEDGDGEEIMANAKSLTTDAGNHDAYAFLLRELLTTELNHVSGRGLSDLQLQAILVGWGETVLNNNAPNALSSFSALKIGDGPQRAVTSPLEDGGTIFRKVNGATGGGGTGN